MNKVYIIKPSINLYTFRRRNAFDKTVVIRSRHIVYCHKQCSCQKETYTLFLYVSRYFHRRRLRPYSSGLKRLKQIIGSLKEINRVGRTRSPLDSVLPGVQQIISSRETSGRVLLFSEGLYLFLFRFVIMPMKYKILRHKID